MLYPVDGTGPAAHAQGSTDSVLVPGCKSPARAGRGVAQRRGSGRGGAGRVLASSPSSVAWVTSEPPLSAWHAAAGGGVQAALMGVFWAVAR